MNKMSWLDLYNYLHAQANGLDHLGKFDWNSPVMVHDAETGEEYFCDTYIFNHQPTITINIDSVIAEKGNS
jgi:hypothetical protein